MGKKTPVKQAQAARRFSSATVIGIVVAVAAVGAVLLWPSATSTDSSSDSASKSAPQATPELIASAAAKAAVGPHKQASYPPIPFQAYTPPRSQDVVADAYRFAAEHPEITSYVPCFCGCERAGHQGNTDCFVKQRDANGDVVAWDEHGLDCAVCIDVATVARQMHASGASVRDIRAAIDKQFGSLYPGTMPTPHPPSAHPSN